MANTKSAKKRSRQNPKRAARNVRIKSSVKTAVRAAREAITENKKDFAVVLTNAISTLSKAATKGTLHKKNASRRISRLMKAANKMGAAAATVVATPAKKKAAPKAKAKAAK